MYFYSFYDEFKWNGNFWPETQNYLTRNEHNMRVKFSAGPTMSAIGIILLAAITVSN